MWQISPWMVTGRGALDGNAAGSFGTEANTFLARTSGLNATHTNAYGAFIDGLVADGLWSLIDVMWVLATADATTAGLNLKSTSYTLGAVNAPTFTADQGYAGDGSTSYMTTGFTLTTNAVQYTQNSAHVAIRNNTSSTSNSDGILAGCNSCHVLFKSATGPANTYQRINLAAGSPTTGNTNRKGFYIGSRTASNLTTTYKAGSALGTIADASAALVPRAPYIGCNNASGTAGSFTTDQASFYSLGAGLDATQAANFTTRVEAYMTAVGAP